jgi:hypothetical protein
MRSPGRSFAAALIAAASLGLLPRDAPALSPARPQTQEYTMTVQTRDATAEIVRLVLAHEDLAGYFHVDTIPERKPLVVVADVDPSVLSSLKKFGEPIVARRTKPAGGAPCFEVTVLKIDGDRASVEFRYAPEGVSGTAALRRFGGQWTIADFDIWEE